jgi:hypothetical protein
MCAVYVLLIRDDDAAALYELVVERRRLIRRLDELNEILFEIGGIHLENPAAEQAQGRPANPVEMANLDPAIYLYSSDLLKHHLR